MGYLLLAIAIFFGVAKGFFGKRTGNFVADAATSTQVSMIRLAFCVVFGGLMLIPEIYQNGFGILKLSGNILLTTLISGIANAAMLVLWLLIIRQGALVLVDIFGLLGTLVPLIYSSIFFSESLQPNHLLGFVLLAFAVWLLCSYNNSVKPKITPKLALLLVLFALACGVGDLSQKIFVMQAQNAIPTSVFNLYTYLFACGILALICLFLKVRPANQTTPSKNPISKRVLLYVLLMAVCLYLNLLFKTGSAHYMNATNIYPFYQGALMITNCMVAAIFFKEKINFKSIAGILAGIAALCIINLL